MSKFTKGALGIAVCGKVIEFNTTDDGFATTVVGNWGRNERQWIGKYV